MKNTINENKIKKIIKNEELIEKYEQKLYCITNALEVRGEHPITDDLKYLKKLEKHYHKKIHKLHQKNQELKENVR